MTDPCLSMLLLNIIHVILVKSDDKLWIINMATAHNYLHVICSGNTFKLLIPITSGLSAGVRGAYCHHIHVLLLQRILDGRLSL